jgi:hypothetical protein
MDPNTYNPNNPTGTVPSDRPLAKPNGFEIKNQEEPKRCGAKVQRSMTRPNKP